MASEILFCMAGDVEKLASAGRRDNGIAALGTAVLRDGITVLETRKQFIEKL